MDFLKNQFQRIQQQLSGLSASQKMLTGALVAIMVMTLTYWGRNAGVAEMEPLLDRSFDAATISKISTALTGRNIKFKVNGDRILVPTEQKWDALAEVTFAKLLPDDTSEGFDKMLSNLKFYASPTERDVVLNRAREGMCAQIIGRYPGVDHAAVMITSDTKRLLGRASIMPSATVDISTSSGPEINKRLTEAAAAMVAGAVAGLDRSKVNVTINGLHMRSSGGDEDGAGGSGDQLEAIQSYERHREKQIRDILSDIPGVFVSVAATLNTADTEKSQEKYLKDGTLNELEETRTQESETTTGQPEDEPGVVPNVGGGTANGEMSVAKNNGNVNKTSEKTTEEKMRVLPGVEKTKTIQRGGDAKIKTAAVRIPRSYFWTSLKNMNSEGKAPDDKALDRYITEQLPLLKDMVVHSSGIEDAKAVTMMSYADALPLTVAAGTPLAASMTGPMSITSYGKEIALSGLALVSLFMLMMMVKRSAPAPAIVSAAVSSGTVPSMLSAHGEMFAGEAGDGGAMLDGMELDEDTVKTQHMLDQVSTLVKDNPDAAASLVQRWMTRD